MVRACSYEVGGDVTNPRLANLIERAKVASVPKVRDFPTVPCICFCFRDSDLDFVILCFQSIIERAVAKGLGLGKGGEEVFNPPPNSLHSSTIETPLNFHAIRL
jgi:hypothetical protein